VTEIPEHLLRRSRERRAALSGGDGEGGATAETATPTATAQAAATAADAPRAASPVPVEAGRAPAVRAGGGGGTGTLTDAAPMADEPDAKPRLGPTRARVPMWVMPVLAALPLWGVVYLGAFGSRQKVAANDPVTLGGAIFAANCSSCHGANGQGGVGPQLSNGMVLKTWPNVADHINWVHTGGAPFVGKTYGATNHAVPASNVMPAFGTDKGGALTDEQIRDVVAYERVGL